MTRPGAPPAPPCPHPPPPHQNLRSSLARRLSPLLLLAAALVALAVFFAPGGQPAQAQTTTVWSATLTTQRIASTNGCSNFIPTASQNCSTTSVLTDDDFTYSGVDYQVNVVTLGDDASLTLSLSKAVPSGLSLNVDGTAFSVASGSLANSGKNVTWASSGLSWSAGDTVSLSLTERATTTPTEPDRTQTFPYLDRLPVDENVEPATPSQRTPERGSASDGYCYLAEGNGQTEYVRYPDGRIAETTRPTHSTASAYIRSLFACE